MRLTFILILIYCTQCFSIEQSSDIEFRGQRIKKTSHSPENWNSPKEHQSVAINYSITGEYKSNHYNIGVFNRNEYSSLFQERSILKDTIFASKKNVSREIFDLGKKEIGNKNRNEYLLRKFNNSIEFTNLSFLIGRFPINYGNGEIFNPINPFSHPTGRTIGINTTQVVDGLLLKYFYYDNFTIDLYLSGEYQRNDNFEEVIWLKNSYLFQNNNSLIITTGLDLEEKKIGGEYVHNFKETMIFFQLMYNNGIGITKNRTDFLFAIDQQFTEKWHFRLEYAFEDLAEDMTYYSTMSNQHTLNLNNKINITSLWEFKQTFSIDLKNYLTYISNQLIHNLEENFDLELFYFSPLIFIKGHKLNHLQRLLPTKFGLNIIAYL